METTHRKDKPILIIRSSCRHICLVIYYHTLIKCCLALENISCKNMFWIISHQLQGASEVRECLTTPFLLYIRSVRDKLLVKRVVRVSFAVRWLQDLPKPCARLATVRRGVNQLSTALGGY